MKKALAYILTLAAAALLMCSPAIAGERTAVISVPAMDCGSKEIQADMALGGLEGVSSVELDSDEMTATVTFDDEAVTIEDMGKALAGYDLPMGEVTYPDEE